VETHVNEEYSTTGPIKRHVSICFGLIWTEMSVGVQVCVLTGNHHFHFNGNFPSEPGLTRCLSVFFLHLLQKRTFGDKWQLPWSTNSVKELKGIKALTTTREIPPGKFHSPHLLFIHHQTPKEGTLLLLLGVCGID